MWTAASAAPAGAALTPASRKQRTIGPATMHRVHEPLAEEWGPSLALVFTRPGGRIDACAEHGLALRIEDGAPRARRIRRKLRQRRQRLRANKAQPTTANIQAGRSSAPEEEEEEEEDEKQKEKEEDEEEEEEEEERQEDLLRNTAPITAASRPPRSPSRARSSPCSVHAAAARPAGGRSS
ncbi:unnamed protein product [Prorocentrum cordatum]|uniref:Uncharacterized protein n=1 Tax=Prorocentrum cordatum TaxID=2364126 RepID=A0ABN9W2X6_9DINO|nr:unnamed protein product [Polarella glacialis]